MVTKPTIWPNGRFGVPQITPYTYRDGHTLLELIKSLRDHVVEQLHPNLQKSIDELVADVETEYEKSLDRYVDGVQEFQRIHDAFMSDVNATLIALNDMSATDLIKNHDSLLSKTLREIFVVKNEVDGIVSTHMLDDTTETRSTLDQIIRSSPLTTELQEQFEGLKDDQSKFIDETQSHVNGIVDGLLSDVSGTVREQLGSQLSNMILNDENTIKSLSALMSRQDVVRTDYSELGARILVGTLNNHGADGKQGTVAGGPYGPYWQFSKNVSHQDWGFDRVVTTDTGIEIYTKPPKHNHRITGGAIIAKVDESMAKDHWFVGGSGGGTRTVLQLSRAKSISDRVQYAGGRWQSSFGVVRPSWDGDQLILNHETMYGQAGGHVTFWPRTTGRPYFAHILAQNNVRTVVGFWDHNGNRVTSPNAALGLHFSKTDSPHEVINPKEVFVRNGNIWFLLFQMYIPQDWTP